jgi:hypothetical protein
VDREHDATHTIFRSKEVCERSLVLRVRHEQESHELIEFNQGNKIYNSKRVLMPIRDVWWKPMKEADRTERYSLRSGLPCATHECVTCCRETEMPLSRVDIQRMIELGHRLKAFAANSGNERRLKNQNGQCIFLSADGCTIYSHRPDGC